MSNKLLIRALRANATFSAVTGVVLVIGSVPLSTWLGVETWISIGLGLGLIGFAGLLVGLARDPQPALVLIVIAVFPDLMSTSGLWALGIVSMVVADLAVAQFAGLRRAERSLPVGEPVYL